MIKEAYVSFETAKLLKEKGFRAETNRYYNAQFDEIRTVSDTFMMDWNDSEYMKSITMPGAIAIPTLQMAVAFLDANDFIIVPRPNMFDTGSHCISWKYELWCSDNYMESEEEYPSREEAVEAAIKRVLTEEFDYKGELPQPK